MLVSRMVSIRPYASVRVFNCTCNWLACGPWKMPLSKDLLIYCSTKKVNCRGSPTPRSSNPVNPWGKSSLYSGMCVALPVVSLMAVPGMISAPHSARR